MPRTDALDNDELSALERCFAGAWGIMLPKLEADSNRHQSHRDHLAKIVLDHLSIGHHPDEVCVKVSAEKFLAGMV